MKSENKFEPNYFFSTPILKTHLRFDRAFNTRLANYLLELESKDRDYSHGAAHNSNVSGWRSGEDLLFAKMNEFSQLATRVSEVVNGVMDSANPEKTPPRAKNLVHMYAWANVNRRGAYNVAHTHPGHQWAGVYYVRVSDSDADKPLSGVLEFSDPRAAAGLLPVDNFDFGERIRVAPKEGMLVLFPGWLTHFVHPYEGAGERVSIAFNIRLDKKPHR
ncbi:MAG: hypothetical protein CL693_05590 [Cellvibrionaceae bacterium]|nr:hypothetical protein [Cellvibrionaceae bacterium]|tara:strand:- start:914 stop:1567 length:654 start_codon:yes stop_codon:yes gene_type:complete